MAMKKLAHVRCWFVGYAHRLIPLVQVLLHPVSAFDLALSSTVNTPNTVNSPGASYPHRRWHNISLKLPSFIDLFAAWLNHVLRMADTPNVGQNIIVPVQNPPLERDHFFEVQHIVALILQYHKDDWLSLPIGHYVDLARPFLLHAARFACSADECHARRPTSATNAICSASRRL